jgi:hypothetical protein
MVRKVNLYLPAGVQAFAAASNASRYTKIAISGIKQRE